MCLCLVILIYTLSIHLSWHSLRVHTPFNSPFYSFFLAYEWCVRVSCADTVFASTYGNGFFTRFNPCWRQTLCGWHAYAQDNIDVCVLDGVCVFLCVVLNKIIPTPFYVHTFSISFCSIWKLRGGWAVGILFRKLACLLSLVYLPVRYDSLCSQCTQHYVCTFKMLFIYCNLVARHFVNVYDISHSSKGFEIYIHHTWCRHRHRTHTDYTWSW